MFLDNEIFTLAIPKSYNLTLHEVNTEYVSASHRTSRQSAQQ